METVLPNSQGALAGDQPKAADISPEVYGLYFSLDPDLAEKDGNYQAIREKLVRCFSVWPCPDAEDLADESILRALLPVYDGKREPGASVAPNESPWDELYSLLDPDPAKAPEQFQVLFQKIPCQQNLSNREANQS
ncbi:MAG TPA: hypothetical protein VJ810_43050 [Blastocatellia bacterium]|nr:hypothetical protein [Blastocatellia bacterium]